MNRTKIPWADYSWNPITGCSAASEGCAHCYAASMARRFHREWGEPRFHAARLEEPFGLRNPARIFVCSTSDLFHEAVYFQEIDRIFEIMAADQRHTFMVLTKRPLRMRDFFAMQPRRWFMGGSKLARVEYWARWPLPNVWLGVTAENQERADERIPVLLDIPAELRFVSIEPMLGPVHVEPHLLSAYDKAAHDDQMLFPMGGLSRSKIEWVIAGPETGSGKRPFEDEWIDGENGLIAQCDEWGAAFHDKRTDGKRREFPLPNAGSHRQEEAGQ